VAERVEGVRGGGEEEEMAEVVMEAAGKEAERVEGATAVVARMAGTPVAELVAIEACLKHSSRRKKEAMGWEGGVVGREAACRAAASRS
jgi:hypothetical protein